MDPTMLARLLAVSRVAAGAALFAAPGVAARIWIGDDARRPRTAVIARGLAARDVAIGIGLFTALSTGTPARRWLEAGVVADLGDATATLLAGGDVSRGARAAVVSVAGGAVALGGWLSRALDPPA